MKDEKALLRVNEFAAVLDVTPACVRRWLHERKIASTRIGRLVRIPRDEAMRLVESGFRPATKNSQVSTSAGDWFPIFALSRGEM